MFWCIRGSKSGIRDEEEEDEGEEELEAVGRAAHRGRVVVCVVRRAIRP